MRLLGILLSLVSASQLVTHGCVFSVMMRTDVMRTDVTFLSLLSRVRSELKDSRNVDSGVGKTVLGLGLSPLAGYNTHHCPGC